MERNESATYEDPEITPAEFNNYQRMFQTFDADSSGTIDVDELEKVMGYVGNIIEHDELERLVKELDPNGNGELTFEQFLSLMVRHKENYKYKVDNKGDEAHTHLMQALRGSQRRFRPDATWRWAWESILTVASFYYVVTTFIMDCDLIAAGYEAAVTHFQKAEIIGIECVWTLLFSIDILFNFNTTYVDGMKVVEQRNAIWHHYMTTLLWMDLAAAIPLDLVFHQVGYDMAALVCHHLRLLRAFRIRYMFQRSNPSLISTNYARFHFTIVPVIKGIFMSLCAAHLLVVIRIVLVNHANNFNKTVDGDRYVTAMYYVLYTLTGVGYGDILVVSQQEKIYACFLFLLGVWEVPKCRCSPHLCPLIHVATPTSHLVII